MPERFPAAQQALLAAIVDTAPDAIVVCDEHMRVVLFNRAAERVFGCPADEAIGTDIDRFVPERFKGAHAKMLHAFDASGGTFPDPGRQAVVGLAVDGTEIPLEATMSHTVVSGAHLFTVIHRDMRVALKATAERERREMETRLAHLAASAPGTVFSVTVAPDGDMRFSYVSPRIRTLTGRDVDEFLRDSRLAFQFVHPDDVLHVRASIRAAAEQAGPWRSEFRAGTPAKGWRWIEGRAAPEARTSDEQLVYHGFFVDATERMHVQEQLARERTWLRSLLDTIPDPVWLKDPSGAYLNTNLAFAQLAGIGMPDVIGSTDHDFVESAVAESYQAEDRRVIATGLPVRFEEDVALPDGRRRLLETIKAPMFDEDRRLVGVLGISRDVTEIRQVADALIESERDMRLALDAAELGTWRHDPATGLMTFDERARRQIDITTDTLTFEAATARVHPDDIARLRADLDSVLAPHGSGVLSTEFRVLRRDGSTRWLAAHLRVEVGDGDPTRRAVPIYGTLQDVTDRREAEQAVKRFVSGSPVVIYAWTVTGAGLRHSWTSDNVHKLVGHARPLNDALWWTVHLHPDDRDRVVAAHGPPYDTAHLVLEYRLRRADGAYIWIRDEKRLHRDDAERPAEVIGSWADVTARIGLEEQLRQAQKMEAVGRLAGGIAHDFNNLLTVICGSSELLLAELPETDPHWSLLGEIQRAGQRAIGLTQQLLAFSRKQVLDPRVVDLNDVVANVETMLQRLIGEDVTLATTLSPAPCLVRVDPGQMEQVLLNLAVNARDAMVQGGRLFIDTDRFEMNAEFCRAHPGSRPGSYAALSIRDTGCGMTPEVRSRLFEPFFTTKEPGKGTGLGLAMVFGTIKQSDGYVEVWSEEGKGARFTIYLPALTAPATAVAAAGPQAVVRRGQETVLVVEDEPSVRKLTRRALESFGYHVLEAGDGPEALEIVRRHAGHVALLVTDVVMPKMSGAQVAESLAAAQPDIKVLFVSGYIDDDIVRHGVEGGAHSFLQKPFLPAALATRVREILDRG